MIRSRINYWSCSQFADWLRGEPKPKALGFDEWEQWRKETRNKHPIRYLLAENLDRIQDLVCFPRDLYRTIRAYVSNRFVDKTHCLKTGLPPGKFYELDTRILYGLFNELKEFVEVDLASTYSVWNEGDFRFKFRGGRCPEAGLAYLKWAMDLKLDESHGVSKKNKKYGKPTDQAETSKEIMELYNWWLSRDSRPDPYEISGWRDVCKDESSKVSDSKTLAVYKKLEAIEKKYDKEDEKMLIRLIRIRKNLWC